MWERGAIVGFLSRKQVTALLSTAPPGTFVITFDENAGDLAVCYLQVLPPLIL
jgi:hypothetical protein